MVKLKESTKERLDLPCLKCISVGRAYDLLRDDVRQHLIMAQKDINFKYCRFHAVFHDDMDVVYIKQDGSIGYHWHHIDKIYDFLLSVGLKPFVELNPMPSAISGGEQTMFWYKMNVTPPKQWDLWYNLIYKFTNHLTERYGAEEVSTWFFEVWNEPNLDCFWSGNQDEYFKLYETAAKAVKQVSNEYKIGGPATAVAEWIGETIEYCSANDVPIDFISTHLYPQDEYCRYTDRVGSPYNLGQYYIEVVKNVQNIVKKSSKQNLKIYWTEFNTLSTDSTSSITFLNNTALDRIYAASCIVRNMIETRSYCDAVSYWVISDIFEEEKMRHTPFSGTYGLVTINGIKKASYNAFKLLRKMRGSIVNIEVSAPMGCGAIATEEGGTYRILLWNNQIPEIKEQPVWEDGINFAEALSMDYIVEQATIKRGHGSPYEEWLKMGRPEHLTPFEEEYLNACSEMKYESSDFDSINGKYVFSLLPDEVCYLEIKIKADAVDSKTINTELEKQLFTH